MSLKATPVEYGRQPGTVLAVQYDGENVLQMLAFYTAQAKPIPIENLEHEGMFMALDIMLKEITFFEPRGTLSILPGEWLVWERSRFRVVFDEDFQQLFYEFGVPF